MSGTGVKYDDDESVPEIEIHLLDPIDEHNINPPKSSEKHGLKNNKANKMNNILPKTPVPEKQIVVMSAKQNGSIEPVNYAHSDNDPEPTSDHKATKKEKPELEKKTVVLSAKQDEFIDAVGYGFADDDDDNDPERINLCLSDTKLEQLYIKQCWREKLENIFGVQSTMNLYQFEDYTKRIYKCCLKGVKDLHEFHLRRELGVKLINKLASTDTSEFMIFSHVIHLTWSIMSCIHHFQIRLRTGSVGIIYYSRKKKSDYCMETYKKLINTFSKDMYRVVLSAIITFCREGKLWEVDFVCTELIVYLLKNFKEYTDGIQDLANTVEMASLGNVQEAKYLVQILYSVLSQIKWNSFPVTILQKFLSMLESSVDSKSADAYKYAPLRKGLELCFTNLVLSLRSKDLIKLIFFILKRMREEDVSDDTIVCLANIGIYAAKTYRSKTNHKDLSTGPLPIIFGLYRSQRSILYLLGARFWQNLLNRHNNASVFYLPKIFFQDCQYNIVIEKCNESERKFFKTLRNIIYEDTLKMFTYSPDRVNVENAFQVVALTLVEIPCGYTASCFVTLAMSIQDFAFQIFKSDLVRSHHLHAVVLSILTLICYIHNAEVLYDYVNSVMEKRAEWAPHLNPPLKSQYEYAQHHVLWNKRDLFFEDWESRYGLWKCFRVRATS